MARPLRIQVPGGWYHVVNRGNRRERIFRSDDDRRRFLGLVAELPERFGLEVHAFVLMDNHYHLLLRLGTGDLSRAIQWLQVSYSVRFNWAHRLVGHVFQGRFRADHVQKDEDTAEVARYVHLNPVRIAGLALGKAARQRARTTSIADPGKALVARRIRALDEYRWSSWRVYGGFETAPAWLETGFVWRANGGRSRSEWLKAVRQYTEAPVRQGHVDRPWDRLLGGLVLGDADYAQGLFAAARSDPGEQTEARRLARGARVKWEELVRLAETERKMKWKDLVNRHGDWTRDAVLYAAVRWGGHRLTEAHRNVPGLKYQAAAQGQRRIGARREQDAECARFLERLRAGISNL